jgi:hypothetical protein
VCCCIDRCCNPLVIYRLWLRSLWLPRRRAIRVISSIARDLLILFISYTQKESDTCQLIAWAPIGRTDATKLKKKGGKEVDDKRGATDRRNERRRVPLCSRISQQRQSRQKRREKSNTTRKSRWCAAWKSNHLLLPPSHPLLIRKASRGASREKTSWQSSLYKVKGVCSTRLI